MRLEELLAEVLAAQCGVEVFSRTPMRRMFKSSEVHLLRSNASCSAVSTRSSSPSPASVNLMKGRRRDQPTRGIDDLTDAEHRREQELWRKSARTRRCPWEGDVAVQCMTHSLHTGALEKAEEAGAPVLILSSASSATDYDRAIYCWSIAAMEGLSDYILTSPPLPVGCTARKWRRRYRFFSPTILLPS